VETLDKYYDQVIMEFEELEIKLKKQKFEPDTSNDMIKTQEIMLPKLILDFADAKWITNSIYQKVEENIFSVKMDVKISPHSIELQTSLQIIGDAWPYVSGAVFFFLGMIKDLLIKNKGKNKRKSKRRTSSKERKIKR